MHQSDVVPCRVTLTSSFIKVNIGCRTYSLCTMRVCLTSLILICLCRLVEAVFRRLLAGCHDYLIFRQSHDYFFSEVTFR